MLALLVLDAYALLRLGCVSHFEGLVLPLQVLDTSLQLGRLVSLLSELVIHIHDLGLKGCDLGFTLGNVSFRFVQASFEILHQGISVCDGPLQGVKVLGLEGKVALLRVD